MFKQLLGFGKKPKTPEPKNDKQNANPASQRKAAAAAPAPAQAPPQPKTSIPAQTPPQQKSPAPAQVPALTQSSSFRGSGSGNGALLAAAGAPQPQSPVVSQAKHDPVPALNVKSPKSASGQPAIAIQIPPIDWKEALKQVGDDRDFLDEVLRDLMEEAKTAEDDILDAINRKDYGGVMRAAHRIKGSASYLSCEPLKNISYTLQQSGHEVEEGKVDEDGNINEGGKVVNLLEKIKSEYSEFKERLKELREAVNNGIPPNI